MNFEKRGNQNVYSTAGSPSSCDIGFKKVVSVTASRTEQQRSRYFRDGESESDLDFLHEFIKANEKLRNEEYNSTTNDTDHHQPIEESTKGDDEDPVKESPAGGSHDNSKTGETSLDLAVTSFHRNALGIQRLGAVSVTPGRRNSYDEEDHTDVEEFMNPHSSSLRYEIEAELVASEVRPDDVEQAMVQPMKIAQAEVMDEKTLSRIQGKSDDDVKQRKFLLRICLTIVITIVVTVLATVLVVVTTNSNRGGDNSTNLKQQQQQQLTSANTNQNSTNLGTSDNSYQNSLGRTKSNISDPLDVTSYPTISQHAILFETEVDCQNITSGTSSLMSMTLSCGNSINTDGLENIKYETATVNVKCAQNMVNHLECTADISQNISMGFAVVVTCGTDHKVTSFNKDVRFSYSKLEISPMTGIGCRSEPKVSVSYNRFCGDTSVDLGNWSIRSALIDADSCPDNQFLVGSGNWTFCRSEAACGTGQYPCSQNITFGGTTAYDYLQDGTCINPGGNTTHYHDIDRSMIWNQFNPIYRILNAKE